MTTQSLNSIDHDDRADMPARVDTVEVPQRSRSYFASLGIDTIDLLTLAAVFLLCIGFAPMSLVQGWTPRIAVLLATLPLSAIVLLRQVRVGDRLAVASALLVSWTLLAALVSGDPVGGLLGNYGADQSGLVIIGSIGLFALGRNLSPASRRHLGAVFVVGVGLSCLVGLAQFLLRVESGPFAIGGGRVFGLASNPVYFGSLAAGALAVVAGRGLRTGGTWLGSGIIVAGFAMSVVLSGSRAAIVGVVVGVGWSLLRWRTWREVAVAAGAVIGTLIGNVLVGSYGAGSIERLAEAGSNGRLSVWRSSVAPILERPVFGWGPGQFRTAVQSHFTAEFQMTEGTGLLNSTRDPHNIVIAVAVSLGLVGLVIATMLFLGLVRRARGPLALGAAVIALSWLLQPAPVMTLPLALVLVGASLPALGVSKMRAGHDEDGERDADEGPDGQLRRLRLAHVIALIAGLSVAAYLLVADARIRAAAESFDARAVESAIAWLPDDPILADVVTVVWMTDQSVPPSEAVDRSAEWAARSAELQPEVGAWWSKLAIRQFFAGETVDARASAARALSLEPYSYAALSVLNEIAAVERDERLAAEIREASCAVGLVDCRTGRRITPTDN